MGSASSSLHNYELSTPNRLFALGISKNQLNEVSFADASVEPSLLDLLLHPEPMYTVYPSTFLSSGTSLHEKISTADLEEHIMGDLRRVQLAAEEPRSTLRELLLANPYMLYSSKFMRYVAWKLHQIRERCFQLCFRISVLSYLLYIPCFLLGLLLFYGVSPLLYLLVDVPFCRTCLPGGVGDIKYRRQVMHDYAKCNSVVVDRTIREEVEKLVKKGKLRFRDYYIYFWHGEDTVDVGTVQGSHIEERFLVVFADNDCELANQARDRSPGHKHRSNSKQLSSGQISSNNQGSPGQTLSTQVSFDRKSADSMQISPKSQNSVHFFRDSSRSHRKSTRYQMFEQHHVESKEECAVGIAEVEVHEALDLHTDLQSTTIDEEEEEDEDEELPV